MVISGGVDQTARFTSGSCLRIFFSPTKSLRFIARPAIGAFRRNCKDATSAGETRL